MVKTNVVGLEKRNKVQRRATRIDARTRCALTGGPFFSKTKRQKKGGGELHTLLDEDHIH